MDEAKSVKKIREQLYVDVWAEPMTAVAEKYNLSDNGVRKRCNSLNIPIPPFGYWAKKKAGKAVVERPPLPPYNEVILDDIQRDEKDPAEVLQQKKIHSIELRNLDDMQIEQLSALQGLDLIAPDSIKYFHNWLDTLIVPGRVNDYDNLISRHKSEVEYRETRDKAYPFRKDHIKLWTFNNNKINERDNVSVLPIEVSSSHLGRAYRIADTIIKAFRKLKANIAVENSDKDNLHINLLSSTASFEIFESKTKRRHLVNSSDMQDFRPLYEEIYDGTLQVNWQISGYEQYSYYSHSNKEPEFRLEYCDSSDYPLEKQISLMILEIYKQCCENELRHMVAKKKMQEEYEREEKERRAKEEAQNLLILEERKQDHINSLVNEILEQSNNWFKHEQLTKYADELEKYLITCSNEETVRLLHSYIQLVRKTANKFNPLSDIIDKMRMVESDSM